MYRRVILFAALVLLTVACASRKVTLPDRAVESYGQAAAQRFNNGEFNAALRLYIKARDEAARLDIPSLEARYLFNIGRLLYECSAFDSAQVYFAQGGTLYREEQEPGASAVALLFESLCFAYTGKNDTAQALFTKASSSADPQDSLTFKTAAMLLAILSGNSEAALSMSSPLLANMQRTEDHFGRGIVFCYKAMAVFSMDNHNGALALLDSSLAAFGRSPYRYRNWKSLLGKAIIAFCNSDSTAAERYLLRAQRAAPDFIRVPDRSMASTCPALW